MRPCTLSLGLVAHDRVYLYCLVYKTSGADAGKDSGSAAVARMHVEATDS
jgi:hypothetical protein